MATRECLDIIKRAKSGTGIDLDPIIDPISIPLPFDLDPI